MYSGTMIDDLIASVWGGEPITPSRAWSGDRADGDRGTSIIHRRDGEAWSSSGGDYGSRLDEKVDSNAPGTRVTFDVTVASTDRSKLLKGPRLH